MKKKLLALCGGSVNGNTETFMKSALMGAEAEGMEVELIRIIDCELHTCRNCFPCAAAMKGPDGCIYKDDGGWIIEKVLDCDALLVGAPVYAVAPAGSMMNMRDRVFGPKLDASSRSLHMGMFEDERLYKQRVGGLISVGGAKFTNWTSMGLPVLHTILFPPDIQVVDQLDIHQVAEPGAASLEDELLARCYRLGQHIAQAAKLPIEEVTWMGEESGDICPKCHRNAMVLKAGTREAECLICGIKGEIVPEGEGYTVKFSPEQLALSRLTRAGKQLHTDENNEIRATKFIPRKAEVPERMAKYRSYKVVSTPPSRQKKMNG